MTESEGLAMTGKIDPWEITIAMAAEFGLVAY
jgi:hypothetical protein